jgi:hypothetical protein
MDHALHSAAVASRSKRPTKRRVEGGGRTTPKGGAAAAADTSAPVIGGPKDTTSDSGDSKSSARGTAARSAARDKRSVSPDSSSRYTPPVPSYRKTSGPIVPILMFTFWGLGIAMIMFNYFQFLPGGVSNWYVFGGLGLILAGIVTATQYR